MECHGSPDTNIPSGADIASALREKHVLGVGGNAIVYDLAGTDFVLRVPKASRQKPWEATLQLEPTPVKDAFPGKNFGQAVAAMNGMLVLHRQTGAPAGLSLRGDSQEENDAKYIAAVSMAASMPQKAYNQFADDLRFLANARHQFDPSKSNNVLIDPARGRFNIVDVSPGNYRSGLSDMIVVLMGNTYATYYSSTTLLADSYATIFSKAESAAKRAGLPMKLNSSGQASKLLAEGWQPTLPGTSRKAQPVSSRLNSGRFSHRSGDF